MVWELVFSGWGFGVLFIILLIDFVIYGEQENMAILLVEPVTSNPAASASYI